MALPDLIGRLEEEAAHRVDTIRQDADAEVRAIEAATADAVRDFIARRLHEGHARREAVHQHALAAAKRRARARELDARRAQIARILTRARALLEEAAASAAHGEALPSHLEEALSFLEGLRPRVRCRAALVPLLQMTLARHEGAVLVVDESVGPGILAESADGSVTVDNTLAARLARAEPRVTIELARKLEAARA